LANHVLQLDRLLRASLTAFVADATAAQWQGKEPRSALICRRCALGTMSPANVEYMACYRSSELRLLLIDQMTTDFLIFGHLSRLCDRARSA